MRQTLLYVPNILLSVPILLNGQFCCPASLTGVSKLPDDIAWIDSEFAREYPAEM